MYRCLFSAICHFLGSQCPAAFGNDRRDFQGVPRLRLSARAVFFRRARAAAPTPVGPAGRARPVCPLSVRRQRNRMLLLQRHSVNWASRGRQCWERGRHRMRESFWPQACCRSLHRTASAGCADSTSRSGLRSTRPAGFVRPRPLHKK